ncbi:MAG: Crp/Fnr family transcriptional regulator [Roseivirga sp.]|jgi:CRP-like cAMP-binding protein|uniref:Crp/Fnr family transcriptional regulator n=1 Tax=Roseivirga sp. TaxID=1964215 RepID=UPI001AFDCE6A|nr:Crp/Fnr family transcriptional regulator [Roseivirga sp.]MBO6495775.1 Crp/Fnr family transcriptional regulator [Roseivirga sp.]
MQEVLIDHIRQLVSLSDEEAEIISSAFKEKQLKKKEYLLKKGDSSHYMRFISSGCLKVFSLDNDGNERILQFGVNGWWVNDLYGYLTGQPSSYFIQAITNSTVLQVHKNVLDQLFDQIPSLDRFWRIKIQNAYIALQERTMNLMRESAEERYARFISQYRDMEQSIPQYMIASYLGVTPEHLSAIRKKISKSKLS